MFPRLGCWLVVLLTVSAYGANAQERIRPSQHGTVTQRVGFTDITISYHRPVARGRTLFGDVIAWGRVWTPGADSATTIQFSRDVQVEDQPLGAGTYSMWVIPHQNEPWTVVFNRAIHIWHTPYPGAQQDALRVTVAPEVGTQMEVLAFYFPLVAADSATLRLHWGTTILPLRVRVDNQRR
jgi:hypothetical protein